MKFVRANADKPHRCPCCHAIRVQTYTRWWRTYTCEPCGLRWWRGWAEMWPTPNCPVHGIKGGWPWHYA